MIPYVNFINFIGNLQCLVYMNIPSLRRGEGFTYKCQRW